MSYFRVSQSIDPRLIFNNVKMQNPLVVWGVEQKPRVVRGRKFADSLHQREAKGEVIVAVAFMEKTEREGKVRVAGAETSTRACSERAPARMAAAQEKERRRGLGGAGSSHILGGG